MNVLGIEDSAEAHLTKNDLKPGKHPGVFRLPKMALPEKFRFAAEKILQRIIKITKLN